MKTASHHLINVHPANIACEAKRIPLIVRKTQTEIIREIFGLRKRTASQMRVETADRPEVGKSAQSESDPELQSDKLVGEYIANCIQ
jgi:hypothetical protein